MICTDCKNHHHEDCRGGSHCDCQNPKHPQILTSQQRNDLAVYGTADTVRLCPTCPLTDTPASNGQSG